MKKRSSFTGKIGFVLAAAGSAVGLGNIWRFPYLAAKYGGGMFLLVYILLAVTFGFTLMICEIAIGRKTGLSAIEAYPILNKRFSFVGLIAAAIPVLILPYYSVIGGWVLKYFSVFLTGSGSAAAQDGYFGDFISRTGEPILWFAAYIAITVLIVLFGVEKGIEKVSKVMMPILLALLLFIAVYNLFIPGALDGLVYYIKPDLSNFSIMTVVAAMGQLFYSMSLAMGIMITYGSYMKKDVNVEDAVRSIELFDTGIAFVSGLLIIPAVFAFSGGDQSALSAGAPLMFITLPKVFDHMLGGQVIGTLFFLLVTFAALTSSISLAETVVSMIRDKLKIGRKAACLIVLVGALILGLPSALGYGLWSDVKLLGMQFLDLFDFVSNSLLMPIVALLTCILIGFVQKPQSLIEEIEATAPFKAKRLFTVVIKYVAPVFLVVIFLSSLLTAFGVIDI